MAETQAPVVQTSPTGNSDGRAKRATGHKGLYQGLLTADLIGKCRRGEIPQKFTMNEKCRKQDFVMRSPHQKAPRAFIQKQVCFHTTSSLKDFQRKPCFGSDFLVI